MYVYFNKFLTHSFNHLYNIDQQMTRYSSTFLSSWLLLVIIALLNIDASMLKHIYMYMQSHADSVGQTEQKYPWPLY